jgi:HTH-type transcriptional regulator/antitoxin HigA
MVTIFGIHLKITNLQDIMKPIEQIRSELRPIRSEATYYPVEAPDPLEAIKIKMEEQGLKRKDMIDYFGSASRVSEVLNRKRPLTLEMIRKIHKGLGISAETLLAG